MAILPSPFAQQQQMMHAAEAQVGRVDMCFCFCLFVCLLFFAFAFSLFCCCLIALLFVLQRYSI
jgi:hypothetical protein